MTATTPESPKAAPETPAAEMFDSATRTLEEALGAGVRIQEEWSKAFCEGLKRSVPSGEFQKQTTNLFSAMLPVMQKTSREMIKTVEQNYHRDLDLLRKTFTPPATGNEIPGRAQRFWNDSLQVFRENADALLATQVKVFQAWNEAIGRSFSEVRTPSR